MDIITSVLLLTINIICLIYIIFNYEHLDMIICSCILWFNYINCLDSYFLIKNKNDRYIIPSTYYPSYRYYNQIMSIICVFILICCSFYINYECFRDKCYDPYFKSVTETLIQTILFTLNLGMTIVFAGGICYMTNKIYGFLSIEINALLYKKINRFNYQYDDYIDNIIKDDLICWFCKRDFSPKNGPMMTINCKCNELYRYIQV